MKCSDFELLIALYVEEDLSAVESGQVEAHLQECSSCSALAGDLKESQAALKSIRQDIPETTALSVLRQRVLREVSGLESTTWFEWFIFGGLRRKAALAGFALFIVSSGALWFARSQRVAPSAPAAVVVNRAPARVEAASVSEPQRTPKSLQSTPRRVRRPAAETAPPAVSEEPKQVAIKFVTDDPNIIIYWLVDEKGD